MTKAFDLNQSPAAIKRQVVESIERERTEKRQAEAKRVDKELDQRARRAFFSAQPGASEAAYLRIADTLKEGLLLDDTRRADNLTRGQLHSIYTDF